MVRFVLLIERMYHFVVDEHSAFLQLLELDILAQRIHNALLPEDPQSFLDYHRVFADNFLYMGSLKLEVDQRFYTTACIQHPFDIVCALRYVGKSSYSEVFKFTNRVDTLCFANITQQHILVDPSTRKPMEFPSYWREKFGKMSEGLPLVMKRLARPDICTLNLEYKIQSSDLDIQEHTNFSSYVRLCTEVSRNAFIDGLFRRFSKQMIGNGLKELQMRFENEALVNEEVVVHMWEATDRNDQLCFEITRGLDVCIQATMSFYQASIDGCKFESLYSKI